MTSVTLNDPSRSSTGVVNLATSLFMNSDHTYIRSYKSIASSMKSPQKSLRDLTNGSYIYGRYLMLWINWKDLIDIGSGEIYSRFQKSEKSQ